jgi:polar amino acid transport system substrate-binding protein
VTRASRLLAAVAVLATLAGCAAPRTAQRPDRVAPVILPDGYSESPAHSTPVSDAECGGDPGRSLSPAGLPRGADGQLEGAALDRVRRSDHGLVVGISQTAGQFGRRDLVTGGLDGFEIDIVRRIAQDLFGSADDQRLRLVTMPTGARLYALDTGENQTARNDATHQERREIQRVDMVIADVSVTCTRVKTYGLRYSGPYLATNSGLMIRRGMRNVRGPDDLSGRKVCAGTGTTNIDDMIDFAAAQKRNGKTPLVPVSVTDTSECLMLLQRGQIDAIYTDVMILEGYRQQDPGTVLLDYRAPRSETSAIATELEGSGLILAACRLLL